MSLPGDRTPNDSSADHVALAAGDRLGRYQLVAPVARGGMAIVWAARLDGQRGFSKLFAVKTTLPQLARDPEFERMFLDEARIASKVQHPNVAQILELGEDANVLYIAMEWVSGDTLHNVLRASGKCVALDHRIAARIIADACSGLHAAHELADDDGRPLNVVHRDVSPQNILLSLDGHVKVADFGVAKAHGQSHQTTASGAVKGKVSYMAPEQLAGVGVDRRSDVFALGCVLYEATTGKRPFQGAQELETMFALAHGRFDVPSKVLPGYPVELERIVVRALAREPEGRFATAEEMHVALEEWLARSSPVVTPSQVSAVVRERRGDKIEARQKRIKASFDAIAPGSTSSTGMSKARPLSRPPSAQGTVTLPLSGPGTVMHSSISVGGRPPVVPTRRARRIVPALAALGVAAAAGVLWFEGMLPLPGSHAAGAPSAVASNEAPRVDPSLPGVPAASATPPPTTSPSASSPDAPTEAHMIQLNVEPVGATIRLDGKDLPSSQRSVTRPDHGRSELSIQAAGYAPQKVYLDARTPSPFVVKLFPVARSGSSPSPATDPLNVANPFRGGSNTSTSQPGANPYRP